MNPPVRLFDEILNLAESLKLKLPPVNAEAVLWKYCHILQLPKASARDSTRSNHIPRKLQAFTADLKVTG